MRGRMLPEQDPPHPWDCPLFAVPGCVRHSSGPGGVPESGIAAGVKAFSQRFVIARPHVHLLPAFFATAIIAH